MVHHVEITEASEFSLSVAEAVAASVRDAWRRAKLTTTPALVTWYGREHLLVQPCGSVYRKGVRVTTRAADWTESTPMEFEHAAPVPVVWNMIERLLAAVPGATSTSRIEAAGYVNDGAHSAPWGAHAAHPFTVVEVRFPAPVAEAEVAAALAAGAGSRCPPQWASQSKELDGVRFYSHPSLTPLFGVRGDGIVVALGFLSGERAPWGNAVDTRRCTHWTLTAGGMLDGMFG